MLVSKLVCHSFIQLTESNGKLLFHVPFKRDGWYWAFTCTLYAAFQRVCVCVCSRSVAYRRRADTAVEAQFESDGFEVN